MPHRSTNDPREFVEWVRRAAASPDCIPHPVTLAQALLACSSNVPWRVYHVYSVFIRYDTPEEEAKRIFLDSVNPADPARRDWAARWLNISREPGTPATEFYPKWHALLEEAVHGRAEELERTWPIKLSFGERLLQFMDPVPTQLHNIIWHAAGTVSYMNDAVKGE
ncbi:hypothetical protein H9P43_006747 [Blastocladiella emersonii ATCC 22665]|nr:hypothetical protein H9P43_006747 [Blastocladiella emersonii ATCC 22665]